LLRKDWQAVSPSYKNSAKKKRETEVSRFVYTELYEAN